MKKKNYLKKYVVCAYSLEALSRTSVYKYMARHEYVHCPAVNCPTQLKTVQFQVGQDDVHVAQRILDQK